MRRGEVGGLINLFKALENIINGRGHMGTLDQKRRRRRGHAFHQGGITRFLLFIIILKKNSFNS